MLYIFRLSPHSTVGKRGLSLSPDNPVAPRVIVMR